MKQQLTLGIRLRDDATFDNYFAGQNEQVVYNLKLQDEPYVFLFGENGTGKSHLLQAACHQTGKNGFPVVYLPLAEEGLMPAMLDGMESMSLIALDDIHNVIGDEHWEQALFNLYNRAREKGVNILVSSAESLTSLNIKLADLKSRLSWGPIYKLTALTDSEKQLALQERAKNRGLDLTDDVVTYLLKRSARDMTSLFALFEKLDRASMVEKRKLTIPFIKSYL
ncbi:MAG: DnaA regulatory inactivator Hda [Gammaproteobacteria bacterium]|nr:DnaA regulatory inactivator Hda [Gammaproteobacteria bacterium]MCW8988749.1 DnaA regulatory inactivator Hda [Gammaproteobacteria bacterium]